VSFIDVGQGDSILIDTVGKDVLIDGGSIAAGSKVVQFLNNRGISRLDYVIATHPHGDHIGGLITVLKSGIKVDTVLWNGESKNTRLYQSWFTLASQHNMTRAIRGQNYSLANGVWMLVLNPNNPREFRGSNDNSVVVKIQIGQIGFMLTGDCERDCENSILKTGFNLESEVLKVGHHGSRTSTTFSFLSAVMPSIAVIMAGLNNRYGLPDHEVTQRLLSANVTIYGTYQSGDIILIAYPDRLEVSREPQQSFLGPLPTQVHLGLKGDPSTSVTILWQTSSATSVSRVEYGLTETYGSFAEGTSFSSTTGIYHEVTLTGLIPGTLYHYRVGDPVDGLSSDYTFRTAPAHGSSNLTFTAYGDHGTTRTGSIASEQVVDDVFAINPAFHILLGDISYANSNQSVWDEYFRIIQPLAARILYLPAIGNHESEGSLGRTTFFQRFSLPQNELWYSFNWGNAHFVALDGESSLAIGTPQYNFLVNDLSNVPAWVDWKILFLHFPPYSSGRYSPGIVSIRDALAPIADQFKVDLVLSGHDHNYQRSHALRGGSVVFTGNNLEKGAGTVYVVSGGGGALPYNFTDSPGWLATRNKEFHFLKVSVGSSLLTIEAIRTLDGTRLDHFTIREPMTTVTITHTVSITVTTTTTTTASSKFTQSAADAMLSANSIIMIASILVIITGLFIMLRRRL
jgi:beta-lactamase superfamily II metal-dependent hydrolase